MPVDSSHCAVLLNDHRTNAPLLQRSFSVGKLERILLSSIASQSILRAKAGDNGPFVTMRALEHPHRDCC
jgi:hypothetical protein